VKGLRAGTPKLAEVLVMVRRLAVRVVSAFTTPNTVDRSQPPETLRCPCDQMALSAAFPVALDGR
jgi:hypothetical protein